LVATTILRYLLLPLVIIFLVRIALGIIFLAGNDNIIKKTLDSDSSSDLKDSETFHDSLLYNWIS